MGKRGSLRFPSILVVSRRAVISTLLSILLIGSLVVVAGMVVLPVLFGAPWHPLFPSTHRRILEFAELRPGETLVDFGSGDGRLLIAAARDFDVRGVGVEIDPLKTGLARGLARRAGVGSRVQIHHGNLFEFDPGEADVVYLYLSHQALDRLMPDLLPKLKPSARIVCFRFCLRDRLPDKVDRARTLFLYRGTKGQRLNRFG